MGYEIKRIMTDEETQDVSLCIDCKHRRLVSGMNLCRKKAKIHYDYVLCVVIENYDDVSASCYNLNGTGECKDWEIL